MSGNKASVLVERRGSAMWLRLNRPEVLNGISEDVIAELLAGLDQAERDDEVRSVVVAAEGRAFCSGADLKQVDEREQESASGDDGSGFIHRQFLRKMAVMFDRLEQFPRPVIAAVQGFAVAGGLELVLCCDLIVAAESARLGDAHANYGLVPGGGGSVRLPRRVGQARAKHMMFTGTMLPAADFVDTDLVTSVVPDNRLVDEVDALCEQIAAKSPVGLARMKYLVNNALDTSTPIGLRMEFQHAEMHRTSDDYVEGLAAFNEKRTPNFIGR